MRTRLILLLAVPVVFASCGGEEGFFSTLTTGTTAVAMTGTTGPTTTTTSPTTTTRAPETTTTTAVPVRAWAWSRLGDASVGAGPDGDQYFSAVTAAGAGLMILGADSTGGDFDAAIWTSADGFVWSQLPHDEAVLGGPERQAMRSAVGGGPGLVAVGLDDSGGDPDAAVWTSPDGVVWSRVPHDEAVFGGAEEQAMTLVVSAGAVVVAVGMDYSGGDTDVAVWTSTDGLVWSRVVHDESVFGGAGSQGMGGLVVFGGQVVGVGWDESGGDLDGAVWVSADGLVWSRVIHDESVFGGEGSQTMSAVTVAGGGLVAVGGDEAGGDSDAAVWTSPEGSAWSRAPHDEAALGGAGRQAMRVVTPIGSALVAIGENAPDDYEGAIWVAVPSG